MMSRAASGGPAAALPRYVLVSPARNEAEFIGLTLDSMVAQTHRPERWVIVSDGSTDGTDEIVARYQSEHPWIHLVRMPERRDRSFAAKVQCFNAGMARVEDVEFDVIGNLDADISFGPDYFAFLMQKFAEQPRLGVAGTPFVERNAHYDYRFTNIEHVSGACQLFRRECFADIGGYVPVKGGGIDWMAVTTARMKGWQTRTFTERTCLHHRPMGTGATGRLRSLFRHGQKDYFLGGHPVWQVVRCTYQLTRRPYLIGGAYLLAGYVWAALRNVPRPVSAELMHFHRTEQMSRLRALFHKRVQGART
jgi:glycosyltransferase involved in cell wall biosynthesis